MELGADGEDTALARWLLAHGEVELGTLRACLDEVRARRRGEPGVGLVSVLVARSALAADALARARSCVTAASPMPEAEGPFDVPGFRVLRELARGGMGALFEVEDRATGARRALKRLAMHGHDPADALRFRREAELLARLDHPAVVRVHSAAFDAPGPRIIMDLLEGGSLQERIDRGPLPVTEALRVAAALARGLEHAHSRGVLHRDLKPRNVVFDAPGPAGRPLIVDLGLARPVDRTSLTASGAILGTPAYMAPEQAAGRRADERTDVHALGGVLYAMLTGHAPHRGNGALAVLASVLRGAPPAVRTIRGDVPADVERLVGRAMAPEPADRFPDARALAEALEALEARPTSDRRQHRMVRWTALAAVALSAGIAAWHVRSARTSQATPAPELPVPVTSRSAVAVAPATSASAAALASLEGEVAGADPGRVGETLERAHHAHGRVAPLDEAALRTVARWLDTGSDLPELRRLHGTTGADVARRVRELEAGLAEAERPQESILGAQPAFDPKALHDGVLRDAARMSDGPAARVLRRRLQRVLARTLFALTLPRVDTDQLRPVLFDLGMRLRQLGPDRAYADALVAWAWHIAEKGRAHELLMARPDLASPYDLVTDAVRMVVRAPGVSIPRGEEVVRAAQPLGVVRGVRRDHLMRELGRLHRLEAWRLRCTGGSARDVEVALARAIELGRTSLEVDANPATGHELEEYAITLIAAGRWGAAQDAIAKVAEAQVRALLSGELALVQGDDRRAIELLTPIRQFNAYETRVALAHARFRLHDPGWREDLVAAHEGWLGGVGIEWHERSIAERVFTDEVWWPGLLRGE